MGSFSVRQISMCGLVLGVVLLGGCDDDDGAAARKESTASSTPAQGQTWLQPGDKQSPAQWMVSRSLPQAKPLDDPEVRRVASVLASANALYRESERMIANRAVQLEGMLKDVGISEPAADILSDLTTVAGEVGQTEGFGALSQHYFNLRTNNIGRGEALAVLKSRYGRRS